LAVVAKLVVVADNNAVCIEPIDQDLLHKLSRCLLRQFCVEL